MLGERGSRGLEQMPVRHAGGAHRFARATAEALRDVRLDALVTRRERSLEERRA